MTEVAAPIDRARSDPRPPVSPAEVAGLQEACATAAALHSALELGVLARVSEGPADPAGVAADCGLTQHELLRPWALLQPALRGARRPADAATITGAESLYPSLVSQLAALFRPSAEHAAELLVSTLTAVRRAGLDDLPGPFPFTLITGRRR